MEREIKKDRWIETHTVTVRVAVAINRQREKKRERKISNTMVD